MRTLLIGLTTLAAAGVVGGCARLGSAAGGPATAEGTAAYTRGSLSNDERELGQQMAAQEQKLADRQAQGRYKLAMARCAALGGETRRSCAEEADAEYEIAQAKAQIASAQAERGT